MIQSETIVIAFGSGNVVWWGNLGERDHLGDPGVDGRIILTFWCRNNFLNFSTPVYKM